MNGRRGGRAAAVVLVLWGAAFSLACRLSARTMVSYGPEESVLDRVLGVSRAAFGNQFFLEADAYFHRGVEHQPPASFTNSFFQRWSAALRPSGHVHTEGYSASEIIPWLRMSTRADSHNVEAVLTMAYWLNRIQRPELAEQVLRDAQRDNPRDYRLLGERGRQALARRSLADAARLTDAALRLWPAPVSAEDEEARLDKARLLSLRGILYEAGGRPDEALAALREARALAPQNRALSQHIVRLEHGAVSSAAVGELLDHIFPVEQVCHEEGHEH